MSSSYERTAGSRNHFDLWSLAGWVFLIILLLFTTIPILWMLSTSFKTQLGALQFPLQWIPKNPTLDSYRLLLDPRGDQGRVFLRYMGNSLLVSTATTVIGVIVAVPAAYAFSRFRFPGKNGLFYGVLLRNMFPAVIFLIPLFIFMRNLHLVNSYWSLIITYLTFGLPLSIWLLKGFYDNIPIQLEQAARIDGASRFQAFVRVVMPLSAPGIVATAIYSFILAWNEYVYALTFINDQDKLTVPVGLQRFFTEFVANWPGLMAAAFLMSVPVVVMFLVLQKYFVRALTEGAVKQ
jgi:multiple sugar transport system permease protein